MIVLSATNGRKGSEVGMKEYIVSMPAVGQVVRELIRCKNCEMNNQCSIQFKFADPDDPEEWYCANGKRKEADPDA